MVRRTLEQRLAHIEVRRRDLKVRLAKQDRTRDTRRKVLLGAFVLHQLETGRDGALAALIARELPGFLQRDDDRALLADLTGAAKPETASAPAPVAVAAE